MLIKLNFAALLQIKAIICNLYELITVILYYGYLQRPGKTHKCSALFTESLGLKAYLTENHMGIRCQRFLMVAENAIAY